MTKRQQNHQKQERTLRGNLHHAVWSTHANIRHMFNNLSFWFFSNTLITPKQHWTLLRNYLRRTLNKERIILLIIGVFIMVVPAVPSFFTEKTALVDFILTGVLFVLIIITLMFLHITPLTTNVFNPHKFYTEDTPATIWINMWAKTLRKAGYRDLHIENETITTSDSELTIRIRNSTSTTTITAAEHDSNQNPSEFRINQQHYRTYIRYTHAVSRTIRRHHIPGHYLPYVFTNPDILDWLKNTSRNERTRKQTKQFNRTMMEFYPDTIKRQLIHAHKHDIPLPKLRYFIKNNTPWDRWDELKDYPVEWIEATV